MFTESAQYKWEILENIWDDRWIEDVVWDWNMDCQSILMEFRENFFKKVVRNLRSTGNVAAEWELGSEGRKCKMLCSIVNSVTGIC